MKLPSIILASASPRRRELLTQAGFSFTVIPSQIEEVITETVPENIVKQLSLQKAEDIAKRQSTPSLVIGSDTIVSLNGTVMGKPADENEAVRMLKSLQGQTHQVYTGVTLYESPSHVYTFAECTDVTLYPMSEEEIYAYIATKEPFDKAGAYGIQGRFAIYIKKINGDYNNVVGLPIARLYQEIKQFCI